jgi:hypothetical protein
MLNKCSLLNGHIKANIIRVKNKVDNDKSSIISNNNDETIISNLYYHTNTCNTIDINKSKRNNNKIQKLNLSRNVQLSNVFLSARHLQKTRMNTQTSLNKIFHNTTPTSKLSSSSSLSKQPSKHSIINKIEHSNKKLNTLYKQLNDKNKELNELKLTLVRKDNQKRIEKIKKEFSYSDNKLILEIELLKQKLLKHEQSTIHKDIHLNKINNQLLFFKNKKIELLNKLFEYKQMISLLAINNNNSNNITIYDSLTSSTIINNNQSVLFNSQSFSMDTQQQHYENYTSEQCSPSKINNILLFTSKFIVNK